MKTLTKSAGAWLAFAAAAWVAHSAQAQDIEGESLIEAIQEGGYYLVMRHAHAEVPTNTGFGGRGGFGRGGRGFGGGRGGGPGGDDPPIERERELTQESIGLLTGARHAFIAFEIPVDRIYASPTLRTTQHANELPFAEIVETEGLEGSMGPEWLAQQITQPPSEGHNTILVSHAPNIRGALDVDIVDEGETIVVEPGGNTVGRLDLRQWSVLAVELTEF